MHRFITRRLAPRLLQVALSLLLLAGASRADAARLTTAGALLCTASSGANDKTRRKSLSCNFDGMAGGEGGLRGHIAMKGAAALPPGKYVLVWSVLAPKADLEANDLVGTYRETSAGRLVGGRGGRIVLTPATNVSHTRDAGIMILELRLDPVQT